MDESKSAIFAGHSPDKLMMARLVLTLLRAGGRVLRRCDKYIVSTLTSAASMAASAAWYSFENISNASGVAAGRARSR